MPGKSNIVILGTREKAQFDAKSLAYATAAQPNSPISTTEMFTARPRAQESRYVFDRGPGETMARIMKENLDMNVIGAVKPDFKYTGPAPRKGETVADLANVDAFNIKTHPIAVGDFGHYRRTFNKPEVVILADPDGVDEILTSRALTGTRGQYLQDLMNKLGVSENHLIIRTVPFGMDGATAEEWKIVLAQTEDYRGRILRQVFRTHIPDLLIADGPYAQKELAKIAGKQKIPIVNIHREGTENASGIAQAMVEINKVRNLKKVSGEPKMANIPRSHLGFMARVWEGTSGTRVFGATSPAEKGIAFAVVVPSWAFSQKQVVQDSVERTGVEKLKGIMMENHVPLISPMKTEAQTELQESP